MRSGDGVLLTAHGTVERDEDLPAFLQRIRRGRPAPDEIVAEVRHRYQRIGGSPLLRITREQAAALEARLGVPVLVGMRLWSPSIESAIAEGRARGVTRLCSLPLAPQSVHVYHEAVRAAAGDLPVVEAPAWGNEPALLDAFSERIDEAIARLPEAARATAPLVLSAHSLPTRILAMGDPYERDFRAMCDALVARRGEPREVRVAFQSKGMDGGDWLGPDLPETFRAIKAAGAGAVVVAAIGFLSDHVETLYDLDIEAKAQAEAEGLVFVRARSADASSRLVEALANVATRALA